MNAVCPKCRKALLREHCAQACDWYICVKCKVTFGQANATTKTRYTYEWPTTARERERKKNGL